MIDLSSLNRLARRPRAIVIAGLIALAGASHALAADPATDRIEAFDRGLVETMKAGPSLGAQGRYHRLEPLVAETYDLPLMTRLAVGADWTKATPAEQDALIKAFSRLTIASYAHNFDHFGGERFTVDPAPQTRGADRFVQSHLTPASGAPVSLLYRLRGSGGAWKVIDVYYDGVSQLTLRRSDFTASLAQGGPKALIAHLDSLSAKLLR